MRNSRILALIVLGASVTPALAAPATIEGSWRGTGTVSHRGDADAVRCREIYEGWRGLLRGLIAVHD